MNVFLIFALASAAPTPQPLKVDPGLELVSTSLLNRILSYHVCSPEHCWSDLHLQRLSPDGDRLLCSKRDVAWGLHARRSTATLRFGNAYDASQSYGYELLLDEPIGSCAFTLRKTGG